jgi:hypothetical protein
MLVHDPWLGRVLVEASAWSILEKTNHIFLSYGRELKGSNYGIATYVWDGDIPTRPMQLGTLPDHFLYHSFITVPMMRRKRFTILTCANWTDPKRTRAAMREIIDIASEQQATR